MDVKQPFNFRWRLIPLLFLSITFIPAEAASQEAQREQSESGATQHRVAPDSGASHITGDPVMPASSDTENASFSVKINDMVSPYQILGLFVMPGEQVELETIFTRPGQSYKLVANQGHVNELKTGQWSWVAPMKPGAYELLLQGPFDTIRINAFVKTVFDNNNPIINGYQIGAYQSKPLRQNPRFDTPEGLIEVNETTSNMQVSPNFKLGAFQSHQEGTPKYLALDERLVLKLEMLLEEVHKQGIKATTFTVMSGYRTPWYNRQIGNKTKYSLHLYGRAVDIFIDEDNDGKMDDLNKNGKIDVGDAQVLYDIAEKMDQQAWYQPFIGGLGLYGPKPHRGPFVHVDVRGYAARW